MDIFLFTNESFRVGGWLDLKAVLSVVQLIAFKEERKKGYKKEIKKRKKLQVRERRRKAENVFFNFE